MNQRKLEYREILRTVMTIRTPSGRAYEVRTIALTVAHKTT